MNQDIAPPSAGGVSATTVSRWATLLFMLTALVGAWAAYDWGIAFQRLLYLGCGVGVMLLIAATGGRSAARTHQLLHLCASLAGGVGLLFLLTFDWMSSQAMDHSMIRDAGLWIQRYRPGLGGSRALEANEAGGALICLLPLGAAGVAESWQRGRRWPALAGLAALLLAGCALLLTSSRGAWLALAGGVAVALYLRWRVTAVRPSRRRLADLLLLGVLVTPVVALASAVVLLVLDAALVGWPGVPSLLSRLLLWRNALGMIADYPFTGSGLGATPMVLSSYVLLLHVPFLDHAHSLYLQIAVEQGLPGLAAYLVLVGSSLRLLLRSLSRRRATRHEMAMAAALLALLLHGLVDTGSYIGPLALAQFIPLGFVLSLAPAPAGLVPPPSRPRAARRVPLPLAGLALLLLLWLPPVRSRLDSNLGAVDQTVTELSLYRMAKWPVQDVVRRLAWVRLESAIARYERAIAIDPRNASAHRRLGQIELSRGAYERAHTHLLASYAVAPWHTGTRRLLGESYIVAGDVAQATALWSTVRVTEGQLRLRQGWYQHIGETAIAARIARAAQEVEGTGRGAEPVAPVPPPDLTVGGSPYQGLGSRKR